MGHALRTTLGLALMLAAGATAGWAIYELVQTGSCSTDPADGLPPCPPGAALKIVGLFPAVVVFLIGGWLFATRGRRATAPGLPPA